MFTQRICFENDGEEPLNFWVEPWPDQFELAAGKSVELVFTSKIAGEVEIAHENHRIIIFAWSGCEYVATSDGEVLFDGRGLPSFITKQGKSTRSVLNTILGNSNREN